MTMWTAPEDGWYEITPGQEPRKLTDEEKADLDTLTLPDSALVRFGTDNCRRTAFSLVPGEMLLPNYQVIPSRAVTVISGG